MKQDPISKISKIKRSGCGTQVADQLPSKCKVLSSIPSIVKRRKKKDCKLFHAFKGILSFTNDFILSENNSRSLKCLSCAKP
jgi:hypothetical protein